MSFPIFFRFSLLNHVTLFAFLINPALVGGPSSRAWGQVAKQDVVAAFDATQRARETGISGYTVTEHYIVRRNDSPEIAAELTARSTYVRGQGKTYEILSRKGSGFLQSQVLDRVLDHERELYQPQMRKGSVVTTDNYEMKLLPDHETISGRDCYVIELHPRNKSPNLLDGKAWVDSGTLTLARIKGIPSMSTGVVSGRPDVSRDFRVMEGYAMTTHSELRSKTFLAGATEISIDYSDYRIQH